MTLNTRYGYKIVDVDDTLRSSLDALFGGKSKIGMAHGVFDVVHPGHLRHLEYIKDRVDVLVVSITADVYVDKGVDRPHVPEDIRALNLAALDLVDFVVITHAALPDTTIMKIKPDVYAKGFEYRPQVRDEPIHEAELVAEYGGEVLFTPGDYVHSSSALLAQHKPQLRFEKLAMVMEIAKLDFDDLREVVRNRIGGVRVHVIGDVIVDTQTWCTMIGGQTKTPTISVQKHDVRHFIGGAGITAAHFAAAGDRVAELTTVIGSGPLREFVETTLTEYDVSINPVHDNRSVTEKNAIIVDGYRVLKVDTVDNGSINDTQCAEIYDSIAYTPTDAVVLCDFRHGIFNKRTIPKLTAVMSDCFMVADSQVASRWGNIFDFTSCRSFDLIAANEREARHALMDQDTGIRDLSVALHEKSKANTVLMKLGSRGHLMRTNAGDVFCRFHHLDTFVDELVDPVGAGDAMLAYATLGTMVGNPVIGSIIGAFAAAVACEQEGNRPVTPAQVLVKLDQIAHS